MSSSALPDPHRPWPEAWQDALYGPEGFYRRATPAAHFATSAQGIPGGGELLAEAVAALADRHGCTHVVDLGCGRGELLAHLRAIAPGMRLTGVDVVPRPAHLEVDDWLVSPGGAVLPDDLAGLTDTLVLAHEWLDVVPCPVVARDEQGVWRSLTVDSDGTEEMGPPLSGAELAWAQRRLGAQVRRAEIGLPRDHAWTDLLSRINSGLAVAVDYGHTRDSRPSQGTLTGFRDGREVVPVPDGTCDLTAHVAVDSLLDLGEVTHTDATTQTCVSARTDLSAHRQRTMLLDLLPDPDPTTPVPHELARTGPTAYLTALARRAALATLTARGGLGDFWWVVARVRPGDGHRA